MMASILKFQRRGFGTPKAQARAVLASPVSRWARFFYACILGTILIVIAIIQVEWELARKRRK